MQSPSPILNRQLPPMTVPTPYFPGLLNIPPPPRLVLVHQPIPITQPQPTIQAPTLTHFKPTIQPQPAIQTPIPKLPQPQFKPVAQSPIKPVAQFQPPILTQFKPIPQPIAQTPTQLVTQAAAQAPIQTRTYRIAALPEIITPEVYPLMLNQLQALGLKM